MFRAFRCGRPGAPSCRLSRTQTERYYEPSVWKRATAASGVSGLERVGEICKTDNCNVLLLAAGVRVCCSLCFDLAGSNLYGIVATFNPHLIDIVCISIFLKGDSSLTARLQRLCRHKVDERRVPAIFTLDL
jgi:hypothetical protein